MPTATKFKEEEMKRAIFIVLAVVLFTGIVLAGERWEIRPKYFDIDPNDGFMDPGSYFNPYIIIPDNPYEPQKEIRPKYFDIDPNDGFMDPGNYLNPYIIEEK